MMMTGTKKRHAVLSSLLCLHDVRNFFCRGGGFCGDGGGGERGFGCLMMLCACEFDYYSLLRRKIR